MNSAYNTETENCPPFFPTCLISSFAYPMWSAYLNARIFVRGVQGYHRFSSFLRSAGASLAEATTAELLDVTPRACVTPSKDKEGSPRTCYRLRERYGIDFEQESGKRWGEGAIRARMGERGAERDAELYALNVSLAQSLEHVSGV